MFQFDHRQEARAGADQGTEMSLLDLDVSTDAPLIPAADIWHGFIKRPITGVRRSIIGNYVTDEWRERWKLA